MRERSISEPAIARAAALRPCGTLNGNALGVPPADINVFDKIYEIRNGTGVGVGAPQYGPRRGFFVGFSKSL